MKVTLRFLVDDPLTAQTRRWVRHMDWPQGLPLPVPGAAVVPSPGLNATEVDRVIYCPDGPEVVVDFRIDGTRYDVSKQAGLLALHEFREIDPVPPNEEPA